MKLEEFQHGDIFRIGKGGRRWAEGDVFCFSDNDWGKTFFQWDEGMHEDEVVTDEHLETATLLVRNGQNVLAADNARLREALERIVNYRPITAFEASQGMIAIAQDALGG